MSITACIVGMILAGLVIVFNELVAKVSMWSHHKLFNLQFDESDFKRTKLIFIVCGTALMIMDAMQLRLLLSK
jgi:hypothetical protein